MRKFYSLVLMATALLIGTNAWAVNVNVNGTDRDALQAAIDNAASGTTLVLQNDITLDPATDAPIWLGTAAEGGTSKSIILDLAGHTISATSNANDQAIYMFVIGKGTLEIKNGYIKQIKGGNNEVSPSSNVFSVYGTYKKTANYSNLIIDEDVEVTAHNGTVIAVMERRISGAYAKLFSALSETFPTTINSSYGFAFGVNVDVKGKLTVQGGSPLFDTSKNPAESKAKTYGIKTNGLLASPEYKAVANDRKTGDYADMWAYYQSEGEPKNNAAAYEPFVPNVHVWPSAVITSDINFTQSAAVYASGYAHWTIEGTCDGNIGASISSGKVDINNATITSSAANHESATGGSHVTGSGTAVVINSRSQMAGDMEVTVSGDSHIAAASGYGIEEQVNTTNSESKVEAVKVEGGSIEGGLGSVAVTSESSDNVTIYGANLSGDVSIEGVTEGALNDLLPKGQNTAHATEVYNPETGKTVLVISEGSAPVGFATIQDALDAGKSSVKLNGASDEISGDIELAELEINESSAQVLTIDENASLTVGRVVLGSNAQIIVEAGAKFIVTGKQGIVAPVASNIVLKASESAQATFLFNPAVTSNRHPNATFQLISKAFFEGGKEVHQRFGMPTYDGNVTLSPVNPGSVATMIKTWDYAIDNWGDWSNISSGVTYTDAEPFRGYMLASNNAKASPMTYELKGELVGNDDAEITYRYGWNNLANSYAAPINIKEFIGTVLKSAGTDILATIYLYKDLGNDTYTWQAVNNATAGKQEYVIEGGVPVLKTTPSEINPMQAFLMQLRAAGTAKQAVDYEANVYNPALGISNGNNAPARDRIATSKMQLAIYDTEVADNLTLVEADQFSTELDNGYDAVKYGFNNGLKLYAMNNEERMEVVATDNVEGTFLGVNAAKAGTYTMTLYALDGMEYAIIDMETGKVVLAEEGSTYNFFVEAGHNDYRFQIVGRHNLPTAIENAEVVSNVKGIYTITGQYLGENFDLLPKGVYIVNGVKVIK